MRGDTLVLDANIFIEAHRRYYGLDLCPGFWESLRHFALSGRVLSIDRVYRELEDGGDALWDWAKDARLELFASSAATEVVEAYSEIMAWVDYHPQFFAEAKAKFASEADGWVAAYARVHGATIVNPQAESPPDHPRPPSPTAGASPRPRP